MGVFNRLPGAFEPGLNYDIQRAGNMESIFLGGEGLFLATLSGHGRVWLQSLQFSRLADRIIAHAPSPAATNKCKEGRAKNHRGGLASQ